MSEENNKIWGSKVKSRVKSRKSDTTLCLDKVDSCSDKEPYALTASKSFSIPPNSCKTGTLKVGRIVENAALSTYFYFLE